MKLFKSSATRDEIMNGGGDFQLNDIHINSKITEQMNSNYVFEGLFAVTENVFDSKVYDYLREENIIVVEDEKGEQAFVISKVRKNKRDIEVMARHIVIDRLTHLFLNDVRPTDTNGQNALSYMLSNAVGKKKDIFVNSNISNKATAYFVDLNMYDSLFKEEQCFINRWGGETEFDGFNLYINARIGQNNGVVIASKKNLLGFEINSNLEDLCTRIIPKGFDTLEATPVDSPIINNYSNIYTKIVKYEDVKVKSESNPDEGFDTEAQAKAELTRRAKEQYSLFNVDKIQATYTVDFVELSRTEEYKDFEMLERVLVGDIVTVKENIYNTTIEARVIERVYNPKLKKRLSTKLSNTKQEYSPISVESILKELEKVKDVGINPSLEDYINSAINAGLKDSYVVVKPNELLIMDNKDISKAKNVTRYNKNGLGFSTDGYYGKYKYGFTIDGKINASLIATGILSAIRIQSADGKCWWDLSNGNIHLEKGTISGSNSSWNLDTGVINFTQGNIGGANAKFDLGAGDLKFYDGSTLTAWIDKRSIMQYSKGIPSAEMANNSLRIFSFVRPNTHNGGITGMKTPTNDFMTLEHQKDTILGIMYHENGGTYSPYIYFDKYNKMNNFAPISLWEDLTMNNRKLFFENNKYIASPTGTIGVYNSDLSFWSGGTSNTRIASNGLSQLQSLKVVQSLEVLGNKKCIQKSKTYGNVSYYCVEDTSSLLTDTATKRTFATKSDKNGEYTCKILIDKYVQETINTELEYNVYIDKLSFGDYCILEEERKTDHFIVRSDRPLKFKYKLEGRRRGFEDERKSLNMLKRDFSELEEITIEKEEEIKRPEIATLQVPENFQSLYYR